MNRFSLDNNDTELEEVDLFFKTLHDFSIYSRNHNNVGLDTKNGDFSVVFLLLLSK